MRDEAKANEEADRQFKEKADKLNHADAMIFQTEKQLKELGDKIPADKKAPIEAAIEKLRTAHKAQDLTGIDAAEKELNDAFQAAAQDIAAAQQAAGAQGPQPGAQPGGNAGGQAPDGGVQDVDFEEVK